VAQSLWHKAGAADDVCEAWVVAQAVKDRIKFDFKGQRVAFFSRFF